MDKNDITVKDKVFTLIIGLVAIFVVLGGYSGIRWYASRPEQLKIDPIVNQEEISEAIKEIALEMGKYESYEKRDIYPAGLVTSQSLIQACQDQNKVQFLCNSEIAKITKVLEVSGDIQNAYLYIKAGVSRGGVPFSSLTEFDSIWFYVDSSEYGGHLLRSEAIVRRQSEDGITELLFDLRKIPFVELPYRENAQPRWKNILDDKLSADGEHFIGAFVSTLGTGRIFEMKIGYDGGMLSIR